MYHPGRKIINTKLLNSSGLPSTRLDLSQVSLLLWGDKRKLENLVTPIILELSLEIRLATFMIIFWKLWLSCRNLSDIWCFLTFKIIFTNLKVKQKVQKTVENNRKWRRGRDTKGNFHYSLKIIDIFGVIFPSFKII